MQRREKLENALEEAHNELASVLEASDELDERISRLQEEILGLEVALGRSGAIDQMVLLHQGELGLHPEWFAMDRTDAIIRVFEELERPLHRKELTQLLLEKGRAGVDTLDDVSAALAYLKRTGRAVNLGGGVWYAAASPDRLEYVRVLDRGGEE